MSAGNSGFKEKVYGNGSKIMVSVSRYNFCTDSRLLYYYKDVDVFKNKLGIKDAELLKEAEGEITFRKVYELTYYPVNGNFSISHLLNIHKFIFGDLYYFAGKIRHEDISKGQTKFYSSQYINENLKKLFEELKADKLLKGLEENTFFEKLAHYMAELNIIHPFREGNGRTIREFIRELGLKNGYSIDWSRVSKEELLNASIDSIHDTTNLKKCLIRCAEKI